MENRMAARQPKGECMRLGISTSLQAKNGEEWAQKLSALGCKAAVFPLHYTAPDKEIDEYVQAAKEHDLLIAEVGIWRNVFALDPKEREEARQMAKGQLGLAERIGARCCVNTSGTFGGPVWDGGYKENFSKKCWDDVVTYTQELIDEVKPTHTCYSVEPMPWMAPTGPDECIKLMKDVDRKAFGIHLDFINMINCPQRYFFADDFMDECFEKLGKYILSCHMKDIRLRHELTFQLEEVRCGDGAINLEKYCRKINECDPDMPVILEHLNSDQDYRESLAYVTKRLEKAGIAF